MNISNLYDKWRILVIWRHNEEFVHEGFNGAIVPPQNVEVQTGKLKEISGVAYDWNMQ